MLGCVWEIKFVEGKSNVRNFPFFFQAFIIEQINAAFNTVSFFLHQKTYVQFPFPLLLSKLTHAGLKSIMNVKTKQNGGADTSRVKEDSFTEH